MKDCCDNCQPRYIREDDSFFGCGSPICPCHQKSECCKQCLGTATVVGTFRNHYCSKELEELGCPCHTQKSESPKRDVGVVKTITAKMPEWYEKSNWPSKFLDKGTELLGVDCSALIGTVSEILTEARENVRGEVIAEVEKQLQFLPEYTLQSISEILARLKNNK